MNYLVMEEVQKTDFLETINNFIGKHEKIILGILLFISLIIIVILASQIKSQWAQDSHWHMSLAKNVFSGKGYTTDGKYPHGKYPPGLPFLILPFLLIINNVQIAGLILIALISLVTIIITYKIGKLSSPLIGLLAAIILLVNNLFLFNSVSIMTELPFAFFSLASLYFFIKAFQKKIYFLPAFLFFAVSSLIRYEGFLLILPFAFYSWKKKQELKSVFKKEFFIGIVIAILIVGAWFIRNWLVFKNPFYTEYSQEITSFSLSQAFLFLKLFFKTGYIFPFLSLLGLFFLIKEKNKKMITFLVWFVVYILFHLFWSTKVLRFYVEVLPLICIFASFGINGLGKIIAKNKKKFIAILLIFLVIIAFEQVFIFFKGNPSDETTIKTLNRYESIHELSSWVNNNLPDDAIYIVPDIAVYSLYLNKTNLLYYNEGINYIFTSKENKSIFIFADTLHSWMTGPFLKGEEGQIILQSKDSLGFVVNIILKTELVKKDVYENKSTAMVMELRGVNVEKAV
jgi:hypothetical protein